MGNSTIEQKAIKFAKDNYEGIISGDVKVVDTYKAGYETANEWASQKPGHSTW